jgi:hypothetical protein
MPFWKKSKPADKQVAGKQPAPAATGNNQPKAAAKPGPKPPEEAFWQRYSPNHEFPLSSATSITVHVLAIAFMVMSGWLLATFGLGGNKMLDLDTIVIAGGGGSREGEGNAPGDRPPVSGQEDVEKQETKPGTAVPPTEALKTPTLDPLNVSPEDEDSARRINQTSAAVRGLTKLNEDARKKIFNLTGPGKGQGGSGSGGGKDTGKDIGEGKFSGAGKSTFNQRQKRVLRWVMKFNTLNGNDYRKQLQGLGAILAFPQPEGGYRVYRNLNLPVKGEIEDLSTINRIFWVDEKPESIASLSQAMRLDPPDGPIIAFFPLELEAKLLQLELGYRGKKEEDINETTFKIESRGGGSYVPRVVDQR